MSPFEFLRRCSFQRHFALAKLSLTFGQEIAKRDTLIRMDSYRPVEELGHFPPESEELLKYYSPTSLKRNQHGASICRNLLLAVWSWYFYWFSSSAVKRTDIKHQSYLGNWMELSLNVSDEYCFYVNFTFERQPWENGKLVPPKAVLFRPDPLATSDHRTANSINATEENWLNYMPSKWRKHSIVIFLY